MIVAIDGPAGSGKSTTARGVARRLGYQYLDTGAMYRAVALVFLRNEASPTRVEAQALLPDLKLRVRYDEAGMRVLLGEEDITPQLRRQAVGTMASRVSALPAVRELLVEEQRRVARDLVRQGGGVVLDGRDIGTVVFPDADVKIYMVASVKERARRRQEELASRGIEISEEEVREEIHRRDRQDRERAIAPLRKADDAIVLDTTDSTIEEQIDFVVERVRERADDSVS